MKVIYLRVFASERWLTKKSWISNGLISRMDGPAVFYKDSPDRFYYIAGKRCNSLEEYEKYVIAKKEEEAYSSRT